MSASKASQSRRRGQKLSTSCSSAAPVSLDTWRDVLLDWANCTGLLHRSYQKLNKIDIHAFYKEFRMRSKTLEADRLADLPSFVKEFYPNYHCETGGRHPTPNSLLHRWSLLLHYSCLQSPMPDIQLQSQSLSPAAQLRMRHFFTRTMQLPRLDARSLDAAIGDACLVAAPQRTSSSPQRQQSAENDDGSNNEISSCDSSSCEETSAAGDNISRELGSAEISPSARDAPLADDDDDDDDCALGLDLGLGRLGGDSGGNRLGRPLGLAFATPGNSSSLGTAPATGAVATSSPLPGRHTMHALLNSSSYSNRSVLSLGQSGAAGGAARRSMLSLTPRGAGDGGQLGMMAETTTTTPRTRKMDEWHQENRLLRAQINTERDERVFLEEQLKRNDERIEALTNSHKLLTQENNQLKNQFVDVNTENESPNRRSHKEDQANRRLRKELAARDAHIESLTATIEQHQDANAALRTRIKCVESALQREELHNRQLAAQADEQRSAYQQTAAELADLRTTNRELEVYMAELRRNGHLGVGCVVQPPPGLDLDALDCSGDFLDYSHSGGGATGTASAQGTATEPNSPQTLGQTVIEMQLREQQMLNRQLEAQLARLTEDSQQSAATMSAAHAAELAAALADVREQRERNEQLTERCQAEHVQRMAELSEALATLQSERVEAQRTAEQDRVANGAQITDLLEQVTRLNALNRDLLRQIGERDVRIDELGKDAHQLMERREQLQAELTAIGGCEQQLRDSCAEHERVQVALRAEELRLQQAARALQTKVDIMETARVELEADGVEARKRLAGVEEALRGTRDELQMAVAKGEQVALENEQLGRSLGELRVAFADAEKVRLGLESELTALKTLNADTIRAQAQLNADCAELREQLLTAQTGLQRANRENAAYRSAQTALDDRIARLDAASTVFATSFAQLQNDITNTRAQKAAMQAELDERHSTISTLQASTTDLTRTLTDTQHSQELARQELATLHHSNAEAFTLNRHIAAERESLLARTAELGKLLIDQKAAFVESDTQLRQKLGESERVMAELRAELVQITVSLSGEAADLERLREQNRTVSEQRDLLQQQLLRLTARCDDLQLRNAELDGSVAQKQEQLADSERRLIGAKNATSAVEESLRELRLQHDGVRDRIVEMTAEIGRLNDGRREHDEIREALRAELATSRESNAELQANMARHETESGAHLAELQQRLQAACDSCATQVANVERLQAQIVALEEAKQVAEAEHSARSARQSADCAELKILLASKDSQLAAARVKQSEAEDALQALQQLYSTMSAEHADAIQQLRAQREQLEARIGSVQQSCSGHSQQIMELGSEVQQLKAERAAKEKLRSEMENSWLTATKELESRLMNIEVDCLDKVQEIDRLRAEQTLQAARNEELRQLETQLRLDIAESGVAMRANSVQHGERVAQLTAQIDELKGEHDVLHSRCKDADSGLAVERQRYAQLEADRERLVHAHQEAVRELQLKCTDKTAEWTAQFGEIKRLVAELDEVRAVRHSSEEVCFKLSADLVDAREERARIEAAIKLAAADHADVALQLEQAKQQHTEELQAMGDQLATVKRLLEQSEQGRAGIEARSSELTSQVSQLNAKVVELQASSADRQTSEELREELRKSEAECCVQIDEVKRLSHAIETERAARELATEKCGELSASIAQTTGELRTRMQEVAKLMQEATELRADRDALQARIDQRDSEAAIVLQRLQAELSANQEACQLRDTQIAELRAELAALLKRSTDTASEQSSELAEHRQRAQQYAADLESLRAERDMSCAQVTHLEAEIGAMIQVRTTIELERGRLVAEQEELSNRARADSQRLADAIAASAAKSTQLQHTAEQLAEQSAQLLKVRSELEAANSAKAALSEDFELRYSVLEQRQQSAASELDASQQTSRNALLEAEQQLSALRIKYDSLQTANTVTNGQLIDLETCLEETQEAKRALSDKLATFELKIQRLEEEKEVLARDIEVAMESKQRVAELELMVAKSEQLELQQSDWTGLVALLREELQLVVQPNETDDDADTGAFNLGPILASVRARAAALRREISESLADRQRLQCMLDTANDQLADAQLQTATIEHQYKIDLQSQLQREKLTSNTDHARVVQLELELTTAKQTAAVLRKEYDALRSVESENKEAIAIFRSKLLRERETVAELRAAEKLARVEMEERLRLAEQRVTDTRSELEGKLEKMKGRMRALYNEESAKVKARHETEMLDLAKRHSQRHNDQLSQYDAQVSRLSQQIFKLNEQVLEVHQENRLLRNKLSTAGGHHQMAAGSAMRPSSVGLANRESRVMPASSMSSLIKMEDEEGEQFTNTYLDDLITGNGAFAVSSATTSLASAGSLGLGAGGRFSPPGDNFFGGRDSVPLSELKFRNSMLPRHLRSSYAVQYGDQFSTEDDIKLQSAAAPTSLPDESMLSAQSTDSGGQQRRNTLYKRPGPPTPSKTGARHSLGGSLDLTAICMDGSGGGDNAADGAAGGATQRQQQLQQPQQQSKLRAFFPFSKASASSAASSSNNQARDEPDQFQQQSHQHQPNLVAQATSPAARQQLVLVTSDYAAAAASRKSQQQQQHQHQHKQQQKHQRSTSTPRQSLSARRRAHRRSTLELRQQPAINALIVRQLYTGGDDGEPIATGSSSSSSSAAAAAAATASILQAVTVRDGSARISFSASPLPLSATGSPQQRAARSASHFVASRRTAGRRSSIIAALRPQRPSLGSSARKRGHQNQQQQQQQTPRRLARQLQRDQRAQRFQRAREGRRSSVGGIGNDFEAIAAPPSPDVEPILVRRFDRTYATATAGAGCLELRSESTDSRESVLTECTYAMLPDAVALAGGGGSSLACESFERLLQLKPSQQPFDLDVTRNMSAGADESACSLGLGEVGTSRDDGALACSMTSSTISFSASGCSSNNCSGASQSVANTGRQAEAAANSGCQTVAKSESVVLMHYLDRTQSIESLRSTTSGSFRLGTIPRRQSSAGQAAGRQSFGGGGGSVGTPSTDTSAVTNHSLVMSSSAGNLGEFCCAEGEEEDESGAKADTEAQRARMMRLMVSAVVASALAALAYLLYLRLQR